MILWIRKLLGLCDHKWHVLNKINLWADDEREGRSPIGLEYHLQCEHCGNIKVKRCV